MIEAGVRKEIEPGCAGDCIHLDSESNQAPMRTPIDVKTLQGRNILAVARSLLGKFLVPLVVTAEEAVYALFGFA